MGHFYPKIRTLAAFERKKPARRYILITIKEVNYIPNIHLSEHGIIIAVKSPGDLAYDS